MAGTAPSRDRPEAIGRQPLSASYASLGIRGVEYPSSSPLASRSRERRLTQHGDPGRDVPLRPRGGSERRTGNFWRAVVRQTGRLIVHMSAKRQSQLVSLPQR